MTKKTVLPVEKVTMKKSLKQRKTWKKNFALTLAKYTPQIESFIQNNTRDMPFSERKALMLETYLSVKNKPRLLFINIDGTFVKYKHLKSLNDMEPRPYLDYFLQEVSRYYDIVLHTAFDLSYVGFIWKRYVRKFSPLFFWSLHHCSRLEQSSIFIDTSKDIIVLDDDVTVPPYYGWCHHIGLNTWTGQKPDTELKNIVPHLIGLAKGIEPKSQVSMPKSLVIKNKTAIASRKQHTTTKKLPLSK